MPITYLGHEADQTNPHETTAAQTGAMPLAGGAMTGPVTGLVDVPAAQANSTVSAAQTVYAAAGNTTNPGKRLYFYTLGADVTFTMSTTNAAIGDSCVIGINPGAFTASWSGIDWGTAGAPVLAASLVTYITVCWNPIRGGWDGIKGAGGFAVS